jgi:hypothetical protein
MSAPPPGSVSPEDVAAVLAAIAARRDPEPGESADRYQNWRAGRIAAMRRGVPGSRVTVR